MNANESLLKCRENALSVKTIAGLRNGMSVADALNYTGYAADVTKGHDFYLGLFMEQRKLDTDERRKAQVGERPTRLNTDAVYDDGLSRSSAESGSTLKVGE